MHITTLGFLVFVLAVLLAYALFPARLRYVVLLCSSALFVFAASPLGYAFILLSAWSIHLAAKKLEALREGKHDKEKKRILLLTLAVNLGVLLLLKFIPEGLAIADQAFGTALSAIRAPIGRYLLPIGLSYYTLQAISYVMDVYWERIPAEKSFLKLLLYVSYFPQLVQGPISRYGQISDALSAGKPLEVKNIKYGAELMLWGLFKKLAIADNVAPYVSTIFYGEIQTRGPIVFVGLVCYGIQLYCDFSGGIDIIRGVSQCLGVMLPENFRQPFFSSSLAEFWRRWHISLGAWMKDYVFFPFSLSRTAGSMQKALKAKVSRKTASRLVIGAGNLLVFALVGIWHGTGSKYLGWGLYNGVILVSSSLLVDVYARMIKHLKINRKAVWWKAFTILRTFLIVTIGWVFDCADTAWEAILMFLHLFMPYTGDMGAFIPPVRTLASFAFCAILIAVGVLRERKISVRQALDRQPFAVQVIVFTLLIQLTACFGRFVSSGGFMYANF